MNRLLHISLIIIGVSSQIETNHGCKTNCNCPDFNGLISEDSDGYTYTNIDGCSFSMTCPNRPALYLSWGPEIPKPSDAYDDYFQAVFHGERPSPIDFPSLFGIICENGTWFATKYYGTIYFSSTAGGGEFPPEDINGKKSQIIQAFC